MLTRAQVNGFLKRQEPYLTYPGVRPPYISEIYCTECRQQWLSMRCCKSIWCPICNWKLSIRLNDYMKQLRAVLAKEYKTLMITLTFKNVSHMTPETFPDYRNTFRKKFLRQKHIKKLILGGFYSFDWTVSKTFPAAPFNIHIHLLAFTRSYIPFHLLRDQWYKATGDSDVVWISDVKDINNAMMEVCNYVQQTDKVEHARKELRKELMKAIQEIRRYSKFGIAYKIKLPRKKGKCKFCKGTKFQLAGF